MPPPVPPPMPLCHRPCHRPCHKKHTYTCTCTYAHTLNPVSEDGVPGGHRSLVPRRRYVIFLRQHRTENEREQHGLVVSTLQQADEDVAGVICNIECARDYVLHPLDVHQRIREHIIECFHGGSFVRSASRVSCAAARCCASRVSCAAARCCCTRMTAGHQMPQQPRIGRNRPSLLGLWDGDVATNRLWFVG